MYNTYKLYYEGALRFFTTLTGSMVVLYAVIKKKKRTENYVYEKNNEHE
jgi:hypothetical protein